MSWKQRTVTENVAKIMKEYPESRDDDKVLLTYFWYLVDEVQFDGISAFAESFRAATPEGTITRARRHIHYDPKYKGERYLPTGNISTMRKAYAKRILENYPNIDKVLNN